MKDLKRTTMERSPGADPSVTMLLRAAYAPPGDEQYWTALQDRIVSRLQDPAPVAWWTAIAEWRTVGLVAATIALLVSGATIMREQALDAETRRMAATAALYRSEPMPEGIPVLITARSRDSLPENMPERFLDPFDP
ncbi:MAG TPA: hypothetical protein VE869_07975 [Gemmatimonas sp.]|nr:hypothetical protein [Gemmatimonas sp.]